MTADPTDTDETPATPGARAKPALRAGRDPHLTKWRRSTRHRDQSHLRRPLEWHALDPTEREAAWAQLLAWVHWLHDRYELSIEERLPHCWPQHPGLIEELWALKAWREEIYQADQPSGQAARYWHAEMRQTINAATTFYAAGCRAGHRGPTPAPTTLLQQWAEGDPLAGIPPELLTEQAHQLSTADSSLRRSEDAMRNALESGQARYLSQTIHDFLHHDHSWWTPTDGGWLRITDQRLAATLDQRAEQMARADAHAAKATKLRDLLDTTTTATETSGGTDFGTTQPQPRTGH